MANEKKLPKETLKALGTDKLEQVAGGEECIFGRCYKDAIIFHEKSAGKETWVLYTVLRCTGKFKPHEDELAYDIPIQQGTFSTKEEAEKKAKDFWHCENLTIR